MKVWLEVTQHFFVCGAATPGCLLQLPASNTEVGLTTDLCYELVVDIYNLSSSLVLLCIAGNMLMARVDRSVRAVPTQD